MNNNIQAIAIIGGGVIGAGWAARFLENGFDVRMYDPDPGARDKAARILENGQLAYQKLNLPASRTRGKLNYAGSLREALDNAELIVESVPEDLDIKQKVYASIEEFAAPDAIISSSTSGILPSKLQQGMKHPHRLLVAHPFNPVYLLPLVEIVGGQKTDPKVLNKAASIFKQVGMYPLIVKKEIEGFIADRLLEAVWRESLWLIKDGIATTEEIDDAVRFGFGLRWAQMGVFETYRLGGGEAGMRHFLTQFGPCLQWPLTKLTAVPDLNDTLIEKIATQSDAQSGRYSIEELEHIRDDNLIAIIQALKLNDWGAGKNLAELEDKYQSSAPVEEQDISKPIRTLERVVPPHWTDYNKHMNESHYLQCFGDATDALLLRVGVDAGYIKNQGSYFTVETHIRHLKEVKAFQKIQVTTQVIRAAGKKLHLFHRLFHSSGSLHATGEHLLVHVDLGTRSASEPVNSIGQQTTKLADAHAHLDAPEGMGRFTGQSPN